MMHRHHTAENTLISINSRVQILKIKQKAKGINSKRVVLAILKFYCLNIRGTVLAFFSWLSLLPSTGTLVKARKCALINLINKGTSVNGSSWLINVCRASVGVLYSCIDL